MFARVPPDFEVCICAQTGTLSPGSSFLTSPQPHGSGCSRSPTVPSTTLPDRRPATRTTMLSSGLRFSTSPLIVKESPPLIVAGGGSPRIFASNRSRNCAPMRTRVSPTPRAVRPGGGAEHEGLDVDVGLVDRLGWKRSVRTAPMARSPRTMPRAVALVIGGPGPESGIGPLRSWSGSGALGLRATVGGRPQGEVELGLLDLLLRDVLDLHRHRDRLALRPLRLLVDLVELDRRRVGGDRDLRGRGRRGSHGRPPPRPDRPPRRRRRSCCSA